MDMSLRHVPGKLGLCQPTASCRGMENQLRCMKAERPCGASTVQCPVQVQDHLYGHKSFGVWKFGVKLTAYCSGTGNPKLSPSCKV